MPKTKGAVSLIGPELAKAKTLAAMGYSYRRIGRELGKSDHTIKRALPASPEMVAEGRSYGDPNDKGLRIVSTKGFTPFDCAQNCARWPLSCACT